jgi:hypothetical protein
LDNTTDSDTAASLEAAAVRIPDIPLGALMPWLDVWQLPKIWRDEPCDCFINEYPDLDPPLACAKCSHTGRILEPAIAWDRNPEASREPC